MLVKVAFLAAILTLTALGAPGVIIKRGSAPPRQCFENCNTGYGDCVGVGPPSMRMHSPQSFARCDMAYRVCLSQDCPDGAGKAKRDLQNMATEGK